MGAFIFGEIIHAMKRNNSFGVFLLAVVLFTITSLLMTSCTGIRYTYYNKQKAPCTSSEEKKLAKTIPAQPFLSQAENELKVQVVSGYDKSSKQKNVASDNDKKKETVPAKLQQIFSERNIAKYIPKQYKNIQSENNTHADRELMIVLLVVLILVLIALLGDELLWLIFLALLIVIIYALVKYLGIFN
jgi:Flp pilus assembly protein TadB